MYQTWKERLHIRLFSSHVPHRDQWPCVRARAQMWCKSQQVNASAHTRIHGCMYQILYVYSNYYMTSRVTTLGDVKTRPALKPLWDAQCCLPNLPWKNGCLVTCMVGYVAVYGVHATHVQRHIHAYSKALVHVHADKWQQTCLWEV